MTHFEGGSLILGAATLAVLSWTLRVLQEYTRETTKLAKAAAEQMPRPCVVVARSADSSDEAVLEGTTVSLANMKTIHLANVGTGPAVNVRFSIVPLGAPPTDNWYQGPALPSDRHFESTISRNALPEHALLRIEYESVAGSKYFTEVEVEDRRWVRSTRFAA